MIAEVLAAYGKEVAPHKASARNMGYNISNLLKWWGDKRVADITKKSCRSYVATKTPQAAGQDLKILRIAVKYWNDEYGPLDAMPVFEVPPGVTYFRTGNTLDCDQFDPKSCERFGIAGPPWPTPSFLTCCRRFPSAAAPCCAGADPTTASVMPANCLRSVMRCCRAAAKLPAPRPS